MILRNSVQIDMIVSRTEGTVFTVNTIKESAITIFTMSLTRFYSRYSVKVALRLSICLSPTILVVLSYTRMSSTSIIIQKIATNTTTG